MSDNEEVMFRRLLIDGKDDDRRLNLLQKLICEWVLSDLSPTEKQELYDKIMYYLREIELNVTVSQLQHLQNKKEIEHHQKMYEICEEHVKELSELVEYAKFVVKDLIKRREIIAKSNLLVEDIKKYPVIEKLLTEINNIKDTILNMQKNHTMSDKTIKYIEKHFNLFVESSYKVLNNQTIESKDDESIESPNWICQDTDEDIFNMWEEQLKNLKL